MTIRKKLILSNVLMICIPAFFALIFGMVAFKTYGNRYWQFFEEILEDSNGLYSAQSIVYKYRDDLAEEDWGTSDDPRAYMELLQSDAMVRMERDLLNMGYHFRLRVDEEPLFSSITGEETERMEEYFEEAYDSPGNLSLNEEDLSLIRNTFEHNDSVFEITAVRTGERTAAVSYFQRYVVAFVFLFVLLVAAVIILTDVILARKVTKAIMEPLDILKDGTGRIADGDLDWELDYHKPDEFGEVCREFDRMRGQLKESVETRLQYEQYRRELIAGISHDLRTPLTSIKGYAEGLRDGIANTEEKRMRYYDAIHIRALDMEELVENLSLFARLENRQHHYQLEQTDMREYLNDFQEEYKEELRQKQVMLLTEFTAERTQVLLDVQEMRRVFVNLLENSVKYRKDDRSVIRIILENQGDNLEIRVWDDGPGVPEKELEKIFHSFYRVDEARTSPGFGSGLGLAIVRQIVEGHGGKIHAENNRGLVIVIRLPLAKGGNEHEEDTCG